MSDILSEFGPDSGSSMNQQPRASNGGKQDPKPTSYSPPSRPGYSPTSGPGGGTNHGCCGSQGKH